MLAKVGCFGTLVLRLARTRTPVADRSRKALNPPALSVGLLCRAALHFPTSVGTVLGTLLCNSLGSPLDVSPALASETVGRASQRGSRRGERDVFRNGGVE